MKKFFSLLAAVVFAGSMMAGTYSFTFAKGDLTTSDTEFTYDEVTWTLSAPETQWNGVEGKTGYLFGSKNNPVTLTVSTSGISGTITKVAVVGRSNNANKTAVVSVKVGSTDFTSGNATWDNGNNQTVSFTGSAAGALAVTITPDACGIILAGITVYTDGEGGGSGEGGEEGEVIDITGLVYADAYLYTYEGYGFWDIDLYKDYNSNTYSLVYPEVYFTIDAESTSKLAGEYEPYYVGYWKSAKDSVEMDEYDTEAFVNITYNSNDTYTFVGQFKGDNGKTYKFTCTTMVEAYDYDNDYELIVLDDEVAEGIEDVVLTEKAKKVVVDGNVFVIRDNKMYNITGTRVR